MKLRSTAVAVLRHHKTKKDLNLDTLFAEFDIKKDGKIECAEFAAFFKRCEKPEGNACDIADDDLPRVFHHLDEDKNGYLVKENFANFIRTYMKVVKDIVLTSKCSVKDKDSKTLT